MAPDSGRLPGKPRVCEPRQQRRRSRFGQGYSRGMATEADSKRRVPVKTISGAYRFSPEDHAEIQRLAGERGMTVTQYLTDAALGRLPEFIGGADLWRGQVDARLERLEAFCFGTD